MQQIIVFGGYPDDPSADQIRTAFSKIQSNFNELYSTGANAAVASINKTAASTGLTVNASVGNVIITANIAQVKMQTSTLSMGINANGSSTATLTASGSQTIYIDLPNTISTGNIVLSGNATISGFVFESVQAGISANGSAQANATAITHSMNVVNTVSSGQGVVLPVPGTGASVVVTNASANVLAVYPAPGAQINALGANIAYSLGVGNTARFIYPANTQWYSVTG